MRNTTLLILVCLAAISFESVAQSSGSKSDLPYTKEWLYGINFNTNGGLIGGLMFKYGTAINEKNFHVLSIEAVNVKNAKERRATIVASGRSWIPEKTNYLYAIRPVYGIEHIFFKKAREKGVQVSGLFGLGPSIGIVSPYMIEYEGRSVPYDPDIHQDFSRISGAGIFTDGLSKSKFEIGAASKASLFFEFGTGNRSVAGFEVGMTVDYYGNKIGLMNKVPGENLYSAGFITFYYGLRR